MEKTFLDNYIRKKGTSEYKGKLRENWLKSEECHRRNVANDTISALCELAVAEYLEESGYVIKDLSAWNIKSKTDIISIKGNNMIYTEVKYFPDSPEMHALRIKAAKGSGVAVASLSPPSQILNYFYYRLAQAALQLKNIPPSNRMIFFVFHESNNSGRALFEKSIGRRREWYCDQDESYPGILNESKDMILKRNPTEWLIESNILLIATEKKFSLHNIKNKLLISNA